MNTTTRLLLAFLMTVTSSAQYWRPNSDGHFIPVTADAQNIGSQTVRIADVWVNVIRLKGPNNQLVIDANSVGQRSTIMFQNQMTNIGAFTFRNGSLDNWYISGYGGAGETFNEYSGLETNSFLFGEQDGDIFTGLAGSTLYLTNSFYLPGKFITPGYAAQSLLAADAIIATNFNILVQGNGGARTLTSTPSIAAPTIDTMIVLTGNSDANAVTLQDESTLPGSLLRLQSATRALGLYDKLGLMYNVNHAVWEEVFFSPGGGGGTVSDIAYDASWDGETTVAPSKNAVYDILESFADVDDTAYDATSWNADTDAPTKNTVRDKFEAYASDTVTFTGKVFDPAGTGNVLKQRQSLKFNFPRAVDGAGCTIPNTNDFTAMTFMVPQFSGTGASNANFMRFGVRVPTDIDTSVELTARLTVELSGADTSAHIYHLGMVTIAGSAPIAGTPANYTVINIAADASGASGDVENSSLTTLTGWGASITAGQWWLIELRRNGDDTSTVASWLRELELFYTSSQ